ncbi:hypothetical protein I6A84_23775 [Frankia sp. CNm7]|uniref:Uncharacterized protein n=1 Tax=Frankia nepalensis TaxID=1836974 RepID=A0A937UKY8_9ACTN|nr:hypothetical protein [Frankia nepalensis]MBL7499228.1 hypothetical protein [Frankia nepalensis]MBL7512126.1 hypothetical protein [Frankia nepalensis]MBL7521025.1 hypothetical protein [Frankia nepalensis]MBL7627299.1 hypothetical protein [Frankia nepalensis]
MSNGDPVYRDLHELVDRLRPERLEEAKRTLQCMIDYDERRTNGRRMSVRDLPRFEGPEDLSERVDEYLYGINRGDRRE